jgi:hypothetical protein
MAARIQRREFIGALGSATVAWPLAARAQQQGAPVIGLLTSRAAGDSPQLLTAIRQGLKDTALWRVKTSRSSIVSPEIETTSYPHWRPI